MGEKHVCDEECGYLLYQSEFNAAHWFANTVASASAPGAFESSVNDLGEFDWAAFLKRLGNGERRMVRSLAKVIHKAAINGWNSAVDSFDGIGDSGAYAMADGVLQNARLLDHLERALVDWRTEEIDQLRKDPYVAKHKQRKQAALRPLG